MSFDPRTRTGFAKIAMAGDSTGASGSGDAHCCRGALDRLHVLGQAHGLLDQGLHDLRLGHRLDDLALHEDLSLAIAGRDPEVGRTGLAGTVADRKSTRRNSSH